MIHIGTSGWNYLHWRVLFYPEHLKKKEWFDYYTSYFNTVEINYTFYKWPSEETLDKWYDACPSGFLMTLKAPRMITHLKKLKNVEQYVKDFYKLSSRLKDKMGCHLFQLPGNMKCNDNNFSKLKTFVQLLDSNRDNAIEFRDPSWWCQEVYDLLKAHGVAFVTVAGLDMPDDLVQTASFLYVRFHGHSDNSGYASSELKQYAHSVKKLDATNVYIYFNNDTKAHAPKNATQLKEMV